MEVDVMRSLLAICGDCPDDMAVVDFPCHRVQGALALRNHAYSSPMPEGHFVCPYDHCEPLHGGLHSQMRALTSVAGEKQFNSFDNAFSYVLQLSNLMNCDGAKVAPLLYYAATCTFNICDEVKRIIYGQYCTDAEYQILKQNTQNIKKLVCQSRKLAFFGGKFEPASLPIAQGIIFG